MCINLFSDQLCPYIDSSLLCNHLYFQKILLFTVKYYCSVHLLVDIQCENWGPGADLNMQYIPPQLTSFQTGKNEHWQLQLC